MLETKTGPLLEAKVAGGGSGTFEGYASVFGSVDSYGDTVDAGAYRDTLASFLSEGFVAWGHDWTNPIAVPVEAREDNRGLYVVADFHSHAEAQRARTVAAERLAKGATMGLSIGYEALAYEYRKVETPVRGMFGEYTDKVRALTKIKLYEVSLVTVPAERLAAVTDAKSELKPFPNEHACRLRPPGGFDRFRRGDREHDGKTYHIVFGHPKDGGGWQEQAYRYPSDAWDADEARSHCSDHDGSFEAASGGKDAGGLSTFGAHGDRVLVDVGAFLRRATDLSSLRAKEGRVLSAGNRQRLAALLEALAAAGSDIEELLAATEPPKTTDALAEFARFQQFVARRNGVAV